MKSAGLARHQVLKKVAQAFSRHRRRNQGRASYSDNLRALAISALKQGESIEKVAEAAAVSQTSLMNWQNRGSSQKPQELRLIADAVVRPRASSSVEQSEFGRLSARINLSSGVSIEIPISGLTPSLIATLNGDGGR